MKDAIIYCKINHLPTQYTGPIIEKYIKHKYNLHKHLPSRCRGDLQAPSGTHLEIKVSGGGKQHNKFNFVQIRLNHNCDYLLLAYYLSKDNLHESGEMFIFCIPKEDMKNIILQYGHYAHRTCRELGIISKTNIARDIEKKEYSIRPTFGDACWKLLLPFRINESSLRCL